VDSVDPGAYDDAALVISECQHGILDPEAALTPGVAREAAERRVVERIARLATAFRAAGRPVVHCHIAHRADMAGMRPNSLPGAMAIKHGRMVAGTPDVAPPAELTPHAVDHVSSRAVGLTAFYGTDLDAALRLRGVGTIVLTGVSTDVAVPGLALEAVNRGYWVQIPEDCVAGTSPATHAFMMANLLPALARITDSARVLAGLGVPVA
jgi:nicotinamidase-related amidase